jgi:thioesterase domain-containing protein
MIDLKELENYLFSNIPLSKAMGIKIKSITDNEASVWAPLSKNFNHKQTVFGGSLHSAATLSCWIFLHAALSLHGKFEIVITQSQIDYLLPVTSDFTAICTLNSQEKLEKLFASLQSKKKGRIELTATIYQNERLAVSYQGTFAAIEQKN